MEGQDTIRVTAADRPGEVRLWHATNPKARDFRVETLGKVWQSRTLKEESPGVYVGKVAKPPQGWTAMMVELTYPTRQGAPPLKFTTQVRIVPDVLPFKFPPEEAQK
jgi:PhoPQ-activated pathogenicity-related protein